MRKLHTHEASPLDATGTIFTGAKIHTVDDSTVGAEAFLVFGNRFAAVGTLEECRTEARRLSTRTTAVVELDGATVVPGFVDPHAHPLMYGQMLSWVDCGPEKAHSIPGIIALLQEAALTAPAGVPIRGYGYEHRNLIEGRHPLKEELDQVATDREVYLMNASGHGGVVNSFTFDKHGIDASTENPAGGEFFRDEDGELTGELSDAACNILTGVNGVKVGHHGPNFHLEDEPEE
ncbi:amidohydrolase family protein, partial [Rhodococcus sp. EPR-134]